MNLTTRIKMATSILFRRAIASSLPSGSFEFLNRYGKDPDISHTALVKKYWGWVYSCVNVSANRFASTPLRVYSSRGKGQSKVSNFSTKAVSREQSAWLRKRLGKSLEHVGGAEDFEELEEHPIIDLFQNVNDQENSFEMKELTCTMLDLTGNAYWLVEKDKLGVPSKLFVLRSQWVKIIPDREKFIGGYLYGWNRTPGESMKFEEKDVIHFKYPNPQDAWYGLGPVQAAAYAIESGELREKFIIATMSNMARPDLIVKYIEGELDATQRAAVEREWNAMFRGAKNAGKVKVADHRFEIDKIGWTPQELRFNDGEEWVLKKIASAFPVPLGLIDSSYISRAPRAGMEGSDLYMAQFNTLPRCTLIEEKLNEKLCPLYDERLFVAFDNPVPKDKREQLNEDSTKLNTCVITVNEVRKRDGEEPVPWGDTPIPLQQAQAAVQQFAPLGGASEGSPEADASINNTTGKTGIQANSTQENEDGSPGGALFGKKEKGVGDDMSMEVEGQYVHPDLAGIPIRLRVRNEAGRFDKRGVGRLRGTRDVVEALKT